ncbi:MAG: acyl-CoA synthetase [Ilumatobacteraceae bacterium]|jgi:fatty-acyl-CoA synthase|nr:acyl-CoA synthetase [Ilumatobacteraceae bacterium]
MTDQPEPDTHERGLAEVIDAIAASRADQECLVFRDRRFTWADMRERTDRLANHLAGRGLGCHVERSELAQHESGQDHLAIYLHNGNEYLECMLGAIKARVAPLNVNYRYVAEELRYLLTDSSAAAVVVHSAFAPTLAEVLPDLPDLRVVLQVPDESGHDLLPGAEWYEDALAAAAPTAPAQRPSPDDLYLLYTGGTTGMPKGVMWRNGDAMVECFGGSKTATTVEEFLAEANTGLRALLAPPFMHGAGHWMSFRTWLGGGTIFIQSVPERLDPADIWGLVEREQLNFLLIVGDAFARPLLDELDRHPYDLSSLTVLLSGGAALSAPLKDELLRHLPTLMIVDGLGSSEAGGQMSHVSTGGGATTGTFELTPGNHVLSADLDRVLEPGHDELGWLAKSGRLALGYLGDAAKTARTYPVIDGVRYAVPGDRARLRADGVVELHGRDSVTINSGGEKIFAEEVEAAIKAHPAVYDCVVAGRPSERWGKEVVAIVRRRDGHELDEAGVLAEAERHIARYKLPKAVVFVDEIVRSPSGKADYRWATAVAAESA